MKRWLNRIRPPSDSGGSVKVIEIYTDRLSQNADWTKPGIRIESIWFVTHLLLKITQLLKSVFQHNNSVYVKIGKSQIISLNWLVLFRNPWNKTELLKLAEVLEWCSVAVSFEGTHHCFRISSFGCPIESLIVPLIEWPNLEQAILANQPRETRDSVCIWIKKTI